MSARVYGVLVPAGVLGEDLAFYRGLLGVEEAFVDGDRYAAFPGADGVRLALASGEEAVVDRVALVIRVDDVHAALARVVELGGSVPTPVQQGPHELRAVATDPSGNPLVLTQKS